MPGQHDEKEIRPAADSLAKAGHDLAGPVDTDVLRIESTTVASAGMPNSARTQQRIPARALIQVADTPQESTLIRVAPPGSRPSVRRLSRAEVRSTRSARRRPADDRRTRRG